MEWLPPLGVTSALGAYAGVAIAMVVVEVYLLVQIVPRAGGPPTLSRMSIGVSALLGSAAFLLTLLDLVFFPDSTVAATVVLWGLNFMMFAPPGIWVIAIIVYHDRRVDPNAWEWPVLIALNATGAEVLMGLLFSVSTPAPVLSWTTVALSLVSPWFDWSMAAAMAALAVWVPLSPAKREALLALVAASIVAPWVVGVPLLGALLMTATMGATFGLFYRRLVTSPSLAPAEVNLLLAVSLAFVAMAGAEWAYLAVGGTDGLLAFGTITMGVMAADLAYVSRWGLRGLAGIPSDRTPSVEPAPSSPSLPSLSATESPPPTAWSEGTPSASAPLRSPTLGDEPLPTTKT
jgi:hypothetical protein